MKNETFFGRITALTAIISGPLALGASMAVIIAIDADPDIINDKTKMIALGGDVADAFRGAEFVGMIGYGLLLVPLIVYLWQWLKPQAPDLIMVYTLFGLASVLVGVIASCVFIATIPPMIDAYQGASEADGAVLVTVFSTFFDFAISGLLGLSALLAGVWWMGIGWHLRVEGRALGIATILLGAASLGYGLGEMIRFQPLISLEGVTFFGPIWAIWVGMVIWRQAGNAVLSEATTATA
jgi:hypothetical protein